MNEYLRYDDWDDLYALVRDLFFAAAISCFLYAMHRIANGVAIGGRVTALDQLGDAYTPEEREQLIHVIKRNSLKY